MELIYPATKPLSREDLLVFINQNFELLKDLEAAEHRKALDTVSMESIFAKVIHAGDYYGEWEFMNVNTQEEAKQEKLDGLVYFAWGLLQDRFSSPDVEQETR